MIATVRGLVKSYRHRGAHRLQYGRHSGHVRSMPLRQYGSHR